MKLNAKPFISTLCVFAFGFLGCNIALASVMIAPTISSDGLSLTTHGDPIAVYSNVNSYATSNGIIPPDQGFCGWQGDSTLGNGGATSCTDLPQNGQLTLIYDPTYACNSITFPLSNCLSNSPIAPIVINYNACPGGYCFTFAEQHFGIIPDLSPVPGQVASAVQSTGSNLWKLTALSIAVPLTFWAITHFIQMFPGKKVRRKKVKQF